MKLGDSLGRRRRRRKQRTEEPEPTRAESGVGDSEVPARDPGGARAGDPDSRTGSAPSLRSRLTGRNLLLGVGGLAVAGWFFGYVLATQLLFPAPPPPGDLFEVPDLRGLGVASASERLAGAGLELGAIDSLQHPTVAAGVILGQSPLPAQVASPRTPVRVTLSLGPQSRSVPDVIDLDQARARVVLETSGFVVSLDSAESDRPRGRVVRVTPPPGSEVSLPAQVRVLVSSGPPVVPMPLVLGLEQVEAEQLLDSLGLVVADVEEVFRFGRDQGIVVEQEPAADTELRRGSPVRLKVGRRGRDREQ